MYVFCLIRVPKQGDERSRWIDSISKHQSFDFYSLYFIVCERHFAPDALTKSKGKTIRKKNSIPSIFDSSPPVPLASQKAQSVY